jgi:hypothetical protein
MAMLERGVRYIVTLETLWECPVTGDSMDFLNDADQRP